MACLTLPELTERLLKDGRFVADVDIDDSWCREQSTKNEGEWRK